MTPTRLSLALAVCLACGPAWATKILKLSASKKLIAIGDVPTSLWREKDSACIDRNGGSRLCGQVLKVLPQAVILSVASPDHDYKAGEVVDLRRSNRNVAATGGSSSASASQKDSDAGPRNNISVGAMYFIQPVLHYDRALGKHFAVGLIPTYLNIGDSSSGLLSGFGGLLGLSYYFTKAFHGFWIMAGGGYYIFTASFDTIVDEPGSSPVIVGNIGYRYTFDSGLNISLGGGGQLLLNPGTASLTLSGFYPSVLLEVGYAF